MASRLNLQTELEALPVEKVYFQPPESVKLQYDCIVYNLSTIESWKANNQSYYNEREYQLTLITKNPDNPLIDLLLNSFEKISFLRHFTSANLNHYVYRLYY